MLKLTLLWYLLMAHNLSSMSSMRSSNPLIKKIQKITNVSISELNTLYTISRLNLTLTFLNNVRT